MSISRLPTSRRTAIALAVSTPLALAACDLDPPSATPSTAPTTAPPVPDADVVASARKAILLVVASVEATVAAHPRLGRELTPWLDLHATHLALLDEDEDGEEQTVEPALPAPRPEAARRAIVGAEGGLATSLADAATRAASGDLARALASMSAAVTQRVTR